jgi:YVTN family beta-propeller protein
VAITLDGVHAYVANANDSTVSVIATASNTVVATVPVGVTPVGVAITPEAVAVTQSFYLHGNGPNDNPPTLLLDNTVPTATTAKDKDSSSLNFRGGNPWTAVGTWPAAPALAAGELTTATDLHVWLGLKNSDDQGTHFDLRAEVYQNSTLLAAGETYCVTGITRNPALAKEVVVAFGAVTPNTFNGTTDVLSLKVLTRIGTNGAGGACGGHSNAVGVRAYFDAVSRPAQFTVTFEP